jgi:hypothetical protein
MPLPGASASRLHRVPGANCPVRTIPGPWQMPGGDPAVLASQESKAEGLAIPPFNTAFLLQYGHHRSI